MNEANTTTSQELFSHLFEACNILRGPINQDEYKSYVTSYSNRKVWWRCGKGHEWFALISSRSDGHGCPYCTGQLVLEGYNDLKTTNPEIAEEWSGRNRRLNPTEVTAKSRLNVWWHCKKCNKD